MIRPALAASMLAVLLASCGEKPRDTKAQAAGGEVLPGTVSDAMIDLDRSRAEAPLVAPAPAPARGGGARAADTAETASGAADERPAPAETAAPAPAATRSERPAAD